MRALLCSLLLAHCSLLAVSAQPTASRAVLARRAQLTIDWLTGRLWVREATGHNDGLAVADIIRAGGGVPAQKPEWCGFTQAADQKANGLPIPKNGMQGAAAAWFRPNDPRTYFLTGLRGSLDSIKPGHLVGFNYGRGIHHIARDKEVVPPLRKGRPPRAFWTLAGNEGKYPNAGLHLTYYPAPSIAGASNWLY